VHWPEKQLHEIVLHHLFFFVLTDNGAGTASALLPRRSSASPTRTQDNVTPLPSHPFFYFLITS